MGRQIVEATAVHFDRRSPLVVASQGGNVNVLARWAVPDEEEGDGGGDANTEGVVAGLGRALRAAVAMKGKKFRKQPSVDRRIIQEALELAADHGHIEVLQWWWDAWISREAGTAAVWSVQPVNVDLMRSTLPVLQWLDEHGFALAASASMVDVASKFGRTDVVAWWLRRCGVVDGSDSSDRENSTPRPRLNYTEAAVDGASKYGNVSMLQLWRDSGYPMRYTYKALDYASENGHVGALQWWKDSGQALQYSRLALSWACANGHVDVLQWWKESGLELKHYDDLLDRASTHGQVAVLRWLKDSGIAWTYTCRAMDYASARGHVAVLQWWKESGAELAYSEEALQYAIVRRQLGALEWWVESGLPLKYSIRTAKAAFDAGLLSVLQKWREREQRTTTNGYETPQSGPEFLQALDDLGRWITLLPPPPASSPRSPQTLSYSPSSDPSDSPTSPTHSPCSSPLLP